jgi:serine/threonine protein kinase
MAPELLQKGKMTRAADVYSFAMIMVELFTGKRLFEGLAQQQARRDIRLVTCRSAASHAPVMHFPCLFAPPSHGSFAFVPAK